MILALTGATGFVGGHLLDQALAAGHRVRALTRQPQPPRDNVEWIAGNLANPGALADGAAALVHVAGVVNAPDETGFAAGNVAGTAAILAAAERAGVHRFVHVSSLAAREPSLSVYGRSKREGEALVEASRLDWTIVRPGGVYGPGDMEMRDLFRMARYGIALLPPPGEVGVVAVADLAALLLKLAEQGGPREIWEVDDGERYGHAALAGHIGRAVGRSMVLPLPLPRALLRLGARLDRRWRGAAAKLTQDRVGYLSHPDWTADPRRRPPRAFWTASTPLDEGLAETARWYRVNRLL